MFWSKSVVGARNESYRYIFVFGSMHCFRQSLEEDRSIAFTVVFIATFFALFFFSIAASAEDHSDTRIVLQDFYLKSHIDANISQQPFAASQKFQCNGSVGSGALLEPGDIVLTARHVFLGLDKRGYAGSAKPTRCAFEISDGKSSKWYNVDIRSAIYDESRQRSITDKFDWVMLKLRSKIQGIVPYSISDMPLDNGTPVTLVTIHQDDIPLVSPYMRIHETCYVRQRLEIDGVLVAGYKTDCVVGVGASGAAVLVQRGNSYVVAGVMSSHAQTYGCTFDSTSCFSYAVAINSDIVRAFHRLHYIGE